MSASFACDTSVLVPALLPWHTAHEEALASLREQVVAVPGQVMVETYSVLTRLPAPQRLSSSSAATLLAGLDHRMIGLPSDQLQQTIRRLADHGVSRGATYDGLIAETALRHHLPLVSRDRRAMATYRALGLDVRLLGGTRPSPTSPRDRRDVRAT